MVSSAGFYSVVVTNSCGSDSADTIVNVITGITINPVADIVYCNNQGASSITFIASVSGASFNWYSLNNLNIGFLKRSASIFKKLFIFINNTF